MLDLPAIVEGAKDGKGRDRQVIAVVLVHHYCTRHVVDA